MACDVLSVSNVNYAASKTVLIVEDDPGARKLLTDLLGYNGFSTIAVGSGEEALPVAVADRPDLVVLDIGLPGIDGWETLRRLQGMSVTARIPVVMVTAYDAVEDLIRGYSSGVSYYIAKPYQQEELLRGLRMALTAS
ncbi:MAG: response regulator [Candidatus Binatia bacterium]